MLRRVLTTTLVAALLVCVPGVPAWSQLAAAARSVPAGRAVPVLPPSGSVLGSAVLSPSLSLSAPSLSPNTPLPAVPASALNAVHLQAPSAVLSAPALAPSAKPALAPASLVAAPASPLAVLTAAAEAPAPAPHASSEQSASDSSRRFDLAAVRERSDDAVLAAPSDGPPALPPSAPGEPSAAPTPEPGKPAKTKLPRTVWGTIIGHGMLTVFGVEIHAISQPFLVMETLGQSKTTMGLVRNVHTAAFSLANLLPVGYLVDKTDFRALFIGTSLARALLMGAIPALWATGNLTIGALLFIVAVNPLFQSTMIVAEQAAIMAAVGKDERMNKEATAVLGKWEALAGMFMPLIAGWALGALVTSFGLGGYAMAYAIYASMLVLAVPLYWFMVRDPRDPKELGWGGLIGFGRESGKFLFAIAWAIVKLPWTVLVALAKWAAKVRRAAPGESPAPAGGGLREKLARVADRHQTTKGLAYILRNRTLSILMLIGAVEAFLIEALPLVVLPNFIVDVIGSAPAGVPLIGTILATSGGILGMMFSAEYFGRFFSSWYMEGSRGDRLIERWGHGRFYRAAALSSLLIWVMWLVPSFAGGGFWVGLLTVVGVMGVLQFFHAPVRIVMSPVKRAEIPDEMLGRVESAFDMIHMALASAGALAIGLVLDAASIHTAMFIIAAAVTVTALFQFLAPRLLFPDGNRPARRP